MATVELDEVELMRLRKQDHTVQTLMANPKAKRKIFEAYKDVVPDARIPELEMEAAAKAPVEALEKEFKDFRDQVAAKDAEREKNERLSALNGSVESGMSKLRRAGWTDDGLVEVRKLMDERGILDPEIAAAYYEKQHPPAAPATPGGGVGGWDFTSAPAEDDSYTKLLLSSKSAADNEQLAMNEANKALKDFRGSQQRRVA
jgi:hypothetical protein